MVDGDGAADGGLKYNLTSFLGLTTSI